MSPAIRAAACAVAAALLAGCGASPDGPLATGRRPGAPAAGSTTASRSGRPAKVAPLHHRIRADVLVVTPTPLTTGTVAALRKASPGGVATFRSMRLRVGSGILSFAAVEPGSFRRFAPQGTAESNAVWTAVATDGLVVAHDVAKADHLGLGRDVTIRGSRLRVAAYATTGLPGVDALVSNAVGDALRLPRPNAAILTAGRSDPTKLAATVRRIAGPKAQIHLLTQPQTPYAFLTGSRAARAFGAFSYRWYDDGTIQPDARWVAANIVTRTVPILGAVTCHRLMFTQLRGALAEVKAAGLASRIRSYDGCYVPRFIERNPAYPVSLHTWGIAIDLDATSNQRGTRGSMDPRVVAIFKKWGFRWGGDWSYTDPMHFELGALLT